MAKDGKDKSTGAKKPAPSARPPAQGKPSAAATQAKAPSKTDKAKLSTITDAARAKAKLLTQQDPHYADMVDDEAKMTIKINALYMVILYEVVMIAALSLIFILIQPLTKPIYQYYSLASDRIDAKPQGLLALEIPNITGRAIRVWAATSVTDILTFGFGDIEKKVISQKPRFTQDGWNSFVAAFMNARTADRIRERRQVITSVPKRPAEITWQGFNAKGVYEWQVSVPIIMSFSTAGSGVPDRKEITVQMSIVRTPTIEGIAIENFIM